MLSAPPGFYPRTELALLRKSYSAIKTNRRGRKEANSHPPAPEPLWKAEHCPGLFRALSQLILTIILPGMVAV